MSWQLVRVHTMQTRFSLALTTSSRHPGPRAIFEFFMPLCNKISQIDFLKFIQCFTITYYYHSYFLTY
jgi:hypothetical protein